MLYSFAEELKTKNNWKKKNITGTQKQKPATKTTSCNFFYSQVLSACLNLVVWLECEFGESWNGGHFQGEVFVGEATWNIVFCLERGKGVSFFFTYFAFVVYLQLQDPECLTSSSTPIEQAACFMAHSLGYVVLSLAHTASSVLLSGQVSSHSEQRPRLIRASHRHFFPALHWMSSHDLASRRRGEQIRTGEMFD